MAMGDGQGFHKKGVCVCVCVCVYVLVAPLCPTPCDPVDCSLPGSSIHGILQARMPEWVTFPTQKANLGLLNCRQFLYRLSHQRRPKQEVCRHWKRGVELATNNVCSAGVEQNTFLFVSKVYSLSIGRGAQNTVCYYITITV